MKWIKISSDEDLPKKNGSYYVKTSWGHKCIVEFNTIANPNWCPQQLPFGKDENVNKWLDESINQEDSLKDSDWESKVENQILASYDLPDYIIECIIKSVEENVIAPLLQNECKGDDLVVEASVDEYQLMKDLVDKRVQDIIEQEMPKYKLGNIEVSEGKNAYYLSCKQTAEALLDKYKIVPLESNTSSQTLTQIEQDKKL